MIEINQKNNSFIIIGGIVFLLTIIGGAGYYYISNESKNKEAELVEQSDFTRALENTEKPTIEKEKIKDKNVDKNKTPKIPTYQSGYWNFLLTTNYQWHIDRFNQEETTSLNKYFLKKEREIKKKDIATLDENTFSRIEFAKIENTLFPKKLVSYSGLDDVDNRNNYKWVIYNIENLPNVSTYISHLSEMKNLSLKSILMTNEDNFTIDDNEIMEISTSIKMESMSEEEIKKLAEYLTVIPKLTGNITEEQITNNSFLEIYEYKNYINATLREIYKLYNKDNKLSDDILPIDKSITNKMNTRPSYKNLKYRDGIKHLDLFQTQYSNSVFSLTMYYLIDKETREVKEIVISLSDINKVGLKDKYKK